MKRILIVEDDALLNKTLAYPRVFSPWKKCLFAILTKLVPYREWSRIGVLGLTSSAVSRSMLSGMPMWAR